MGGSSIDERCRSVIRRSRVRVALRCAVAAFATLLVAGCNDAQRLEDVRLSLLAVGDTGAPPSDLESYVTLQHVARALTAEDRRSPAQGMLLLGDNFYGDGLLAKELELRVRANLALPFCRFAAVSSSPRAAAADCPAPAELRNPVPIYAVLGNHDHASPESPGLQREAIAEFLPNWSMGADAVAVHELESGLSLVAFDSTPIFAGGSAEAIAEALRRSQGPWRILAAHHPIAVRRADDVRRADEYAGYRKRVLAAIADADVPVHLFLAAHEHNLQVLTMDAPAPPLHAVAGGGSSPRAIHGENPDRRAGFASAGFARVDLVGSGESERLVVSLHRLARLQIDYLRPSRLVARWSVDRGGRTAEE